ncbi:hypothetical protein FOXB_06148 [Fusarium oxysporum f. sp. conglutinans Fo5176]|uniref:Amino acid permease/ SLC12A domain-containing protein n=4 Tax=Fusarium oxysporum TaxID=5507 RepID=F9FIB9_FUSOF|nr:hypothetical protein FOXB_06148 [Fusarium oxysporum f. sp. conglutinans Fo5176]
MGQERLINFSLQTSPPTAASSSTITHTSQLHHTLGNRQIQLIAIGGSIGTAVFISIGTGLAHGGPGSLFLAYTLYSAMVGLVNNCMAEMAVQHPVSGAFIRMAGHWVDEAFGFMVGWNFFLYEALRVPFEVPASNVVLKFWRDDIPVAAVVAACIVLCGVINAPKFLLKCTSLGLPVYCLGIVMPFPFPAFLAVSNDSVVVLTWLTNVITAAEIIDHIVISITYIFFYRACKAQGIDRPTPPYCGWF